MSHHINEQILENIADDVFEMSDLQVLTELGLPTKLSTAKNMGLLRDRLINQRFEQLPDGPQ